MSVSYGSAKAGVSLSGTERDTDSPYDDRSIRRKNTAVIDHCDRLSGVRGHVIDGISTNGAKTPCTGLFLYPMQNLYFNSILSHRSDDTSCT